MPTCFTRTLSCGVTEPLLDAQGSQVAICEGHRLLLVALGAAVPASDGKEMTRVIRGVVRGRRGPARRAPALGERPGPARALCSFILGPVLRQ